MRVSWGDFRPRLGLVLSFVLPLLASVLPAHAQQPTPVPTLAPPPVRDSVLQLQQTPRYATNLALPTQADDTFLGQDKPGPYVLTWKNFESGIGNPVQVFIDGKLLFAAGYSLDLVKGEITFQTPVKRVQLIRVRYGYYVGIAQKNLNPAPASSLMVSLAALGLANLSMAAVQGQDTASTKLVWNLISKANLLGGGLSSQFNFAGDNAQTGSNNATSTGSAADRLGVRLGYVAGDARNGVDVSFLRGGKQFAQTVGKSFGFNDASQSLGLAGRMTPAQWLTFNVGQTEIRDLTGKGSSEAHSLGFRFGDTKKGPQLNFARNSDEKQNATGARTAAALKENVAFNLNTKGAPTLSLNKTEDTKTDAAGYKSGATLEQSNLAGKVNGIDLIAKTNKSLTATPDKKEIRINQEAYSLGYTPKNQPALNISRNNDFKIDPAGVRTGTGSDKAELASKLRTGAFGVADLVARRQKLLTATPDKKQVEIESQTLGINYTGTKPTTPSLSLNRTDEERKDAAGITKTNTDTIGFKNQLGPLSIDAKSLSADILTPDKKRTDLEQQAYTLGLNTGKSGPRFGFFRSEDERRPENKGWFGLVINRYDVAQRIGTADLGYQLQEGVQTTVDQKQSTADLTTFNLKLAGGAKRPVLSFVRTEDEKTDPNAKRTEVLTNKTEVTSKLGSNSAIVRTLQAQTNTPDPKTTGTASDTAVSLVTPGAMPGSSATFTLSTGQTETGAALEQRQGRGVKLQPSPKVAVSAEQKDQVIMPINADGSMGVPKNVTSITTGAELTPMPGTKLSGAWQSTEDGPKRTGLTQYSAALGGEKNAFQFTGSLKDRFALGGPTLNTPANLDTASAKFSLRPFAGLQVTSAYTLNPEDPAKQGQVTLLTRREYGLAANLGAFQMGGTYALNEFAPNAAETVKAGAPQFGEYQMTLGLRFNRYTNLNGTYKNTFFYGAGPKGLQIYTFGLTHNVGSALNFTMGGTATSNTAVASGPQRYDYKAEAKLGVKF